MSRYSPSGVSYSFGPGGMSPAVKALLIANVAMFLATLLVPSIVSVLGLIPADVVTRGWVWQLGTYMFLHAGIFHLVFNMLALWMFGVEIERMWGTTAFAKYFAVTGVGAGIVMILVSLLPFGPAAALYQSLTIGSSGAIFGVLLAYGLIFPERLILFVVFPIPAKYFVMIVGAIALVSSFGGSGGGINHFAHLGGLLVGYLYLRGGRFNRFNPLAELKYRYLKWKIARMRRRFDVHPGGRTDDWNRRIH